jgi:hypothetical protein
MKLQHEGKQVEAKKDSMVQQERNKNSFKPKLAEGSEKLAMMRKKKVAAQMGIDEADIDSRNIDPVELLRAQGQLSIMKKAKQAKKLNDDQMAKDCTFTP